MKYIRTLFEAGKAKALLRWNLHITAKLRGQYIVVEDDEYNESIDLLRRKERQMIRHELITAFETGSLDSLIGCDKK